MREINCNIVRDLMPSYVDQICSDDSRLLVEEHLTECERCRAHLEMMRNTELTDAQGELKRISCLKKVKKYYVSLILLVLFMTGCIWFMLQHHEIIGSRLFYVIFPLLIIAAYGLLPDSPLSAKQTKMSGVLIGISVLLILFYFSVSFYWIKQIVLTERGPFGIPLEKTGPFIDLQLRFIILLQLGAFVLSNILIFCGYRVNKNIYGLSLTGMYLAVGNSCLLHNMSTLDTFYRLLSKMTAYIILEGIVFSVAACMFMRKKRHSAGRLTE